MDYVGDLTGGQVIAWLLLGLVCGAVAKILLPGRDPGGLLGTIVIGIAGAFLGPWLSATVLEQPIGKDVTDPDLWVAAIVGAFVLLVAYRLLFGHSRERER